MGKEMASFISLMNVRIYPFKYVCVCLNCELILCHCVVRGTSISMKVSGFGEHSLLHFSYLYWLNPFYMNVRNMKIYNRNLWDFKHRFKFINQICTNYSLFSYSDKVLKRYEMYHNNELERELFSCVIYLQEKVKVKVN